MFVLKDLVFFVWNNNPHITDPKLIAIIMQELLDTMYLINISKLYSDITPLKLVMLNYGNNTGRNMYIPHPAQILLTLEEFNKIISTGYTTNPDRALKPLTSHSSNNYIYFQFSQNGKLITQLPAAVVEPIHITPIELLDISAQNRLLLYREQYKFHYQLSLHNAYLNLIINDGIPNLKILNTTRLQHINTQNIIREINTIDSDFSVNFANSILNSQQAFTTYEPRLSPKLKSKLVTDIYNEIIRHPSIKDQRYHNNNLLNVVKALKTIKK